MPEFLLVKQSLDHVLALEGRNKLGFYSNTYSCLCGWFCGLWAFDLTSIAMVISNRISCNPELSLYRLMN
jgi:hypothetical protein